LTGTITLAQALPVLQKNITIEGLQTTLLEVTRSTAQGTPKFRIFENAVGRNSLIQRLAISNGDADMGEGGGIWNNGTLELDEVEVYSNRARRGGGIANALGATLSMANSLIYLNHATEDGGGIRNAGEASLCTVDIFSNDSDDRGGGIYNGVSATLEICYSDVYANAAENYGGGICNFGTMTMSNGTIADNATGQGIGKGGGIYSAGSAVLTSVSLQNNSAKKGGGFYAGGGTFDLYSSTISGNTASDLGPGYSWSPGARVDIHDSTDMDGHVIDQ
jgi:hypothetical protein